MVVAPVGISSAGTTFCIPSHCKRSCQNSSSSIAASKQPEDVSNIPRKDLTSGKPGLIYNEQKTMR